MWCEGGNEYWVQELSKEGVDPEGRNDQGSIVAEEEKKYHLKLTHHKCQSCAYFQTDSVNEPPGQNRSNYSHRHDERKVESKFVLDRRREVSQVGKLQYKKEAEVR